MPIEVVSTKNKYARGGKIKYSNQQLANAKQYASLAKEYGIDIPTALAVAHTESSMGSTDTNNPYRVTDKYHPGLMSEDNSPLDAGMQVLKQSLANSGPEAERLQRYNGLIKGKGTPYGDKIINTRKQLLNNPQIKEISDYRSKYNDPYPEDYVNQLTNTLKSNPLDVLPKIKNISQDQYNYMKKYIPNAPEFKRGGKIRKRLGTPVPSNSPEYDNQFSFGGVLGDIFSAAGNVAGVLPGLGEVASPLLKLAGNALQPKMENGGEIDYYNPKRAKKSRIADLGKETTNTLGKISPFHEIMQAGEAFGNAILRNDSTNSMQKVQQERARYGVKKAQGGSVDQVNINIEGNNRSQGTKTQMSKGELLTNNGKIIKNYVAHPPHPSNGTNSEGDVTEQAGSIVIPKNRTQEYLQADLRTRRGIEKALVSQQDWRANKSLDYLKKGGLIHPKIYANGGELTSDDETLSSELGIMKNGGRVKMSNGGFNGLEERVNSPSYYGSNSSGSFGEQQNYVQDWNNPSTYGLPSNNTPQTSLEANTGTLGSQRTYNYPGAPSSSNSLKSTSNENPSNSSKFGVYDAIGLAAPAFDISMGLFGNTKQLNPNDYKTKLGAPRYIDKNTGRAEGLSNYRSGMQNIDSLPGKIALNSQYQKNEATRNIDIDNKNSGIYNDFVGKQAQVDQNNAQTRLGVQQYNQSATDAKNNFLSKGIEGLGKFGQGKSYDQTGTKWLETMYPGLKRLKRKGGLVK